MRGLSSSPEPGWRRASARERERRAGCPERAYPAFTLPPPTPEVRKASSSHSRCPAHPNARSVTRSRQCSALANVLDFPSVTSTRLRTGWQAPAALLAGIVALYARTLGSGFINDDYLFLESVRRHGLAAILEPGGLANYFRPLSRELWFGAIGLVTG